MYRKYILEKNWSKTTIPALGSGQTENDTPIWGRSYQLDDQNRNPNMNNRDHLVGRPTRGYHEIQSHFYTKYIYIYWGEDDERFQRLHMLYNVVLDSCSKGH